MHAKLTNGVRKNSGFAKLACSISSTSGARWSRLFTSGSVANSSRISVGNFHHLMIEIEGKEDRRRHNENVVMNGRSKSATPRSEKCLSRYDNRSEMTRSSQTTNFLSYRRL